MILMDRLATASALIRHRAQETVWAEVALDQTHHPT